AGYRPSAVPCVVVDNKTPMIVGDMLPAALQKQAGKNLVALGVPPEIAAKTAVSILDKTKVVDKTAKIGILSNNEPGVKATGDTLESEWKKRGYNVVSKVEVNGLAADNDVTNREAQAAATTFKTAGVDTVFNTQSWSGISGFFGEMERGVIKPKQIL